MRQTTRSRTRRNVIVRSHDVPPPTAAAPARRTSRAAPTRSRTTERAEAPPPKRRRQSSSTRTAAIGALEPGHDGVAAALENTDVRGPVTGGPAARERSKLSRIRDGRYARSRSRFIV